MGTPGGFPKGTDPWWIHLFESRGDRPRMIVARGQTLSREGTDPRPSTLAHPHTTLSTLLKPVLQLQTLKARKVLHVAGGKRRIVADRCRGNDDVGVIDAVANPTHTLVSRRITGSPRDPSCGGSQCHG